VLFVLLVLFVPLLLLLFDNPTVDRMVASMSLKLLLERLRVSRCGLVERYCAIVVAPSEDMDVLRKLRNLMLVCKADRIADNPVIVAVVVVVVVVIIIVLPCCELLL